MGLKTNSSLVDMRLSIENITSLVTTGNLAVNQLMEREATVATSMEEPKWTMVIAKNVHQVVS
jgi:hypothetical protein